MPGLTTRRHVDYGRVRSAICPARLTPPDSVRARIRAGISDTVVATALDLRAAAASRALRRTVNGGTPRWRSAAHQPRSAPGVPRGRGSVGPGPPRAAQPQRAHQEGRRPAQRPGPDREHLRPPRLRLHRPRRPARPVPLVGPLHPAQGRASTAGARPCSSRTSSKTSTSCCGSASTAASSTWPSCARSPTSPGGSAATPPTSPTGRTSSCTGSGSRTCRRSGASSRRSACRPPRRAATARGSCWAARSPGSPPTR